VFGSVFKKGGKKRGGGAKPCKSFFAFPQIGGIWKGEKVRYMITILIKRPKLSSYLFVSTKIILLIMYLRSILLLACMHFFSSRC
jgi:hypothetical protein